MSAFRVASLALLASLTLTTQAFAQRGEAIPRDSVRGFEVQRQRPTNDVAIDPRNRPPRFIVEAISFKAVDETHYDWMGSDDVFAMFWSGGRGMATRSVGDVDSGDTERFLATQRCIFPAIDPDRSKNGRWRCDPAGGEGPIEFGIALFEEDILLHELPGFSVCGHDPQYAGTDLDACRSAYGASSDDTLLDATLRYEASEIIARLNPSCRCFTQTATSTRSDSTYQLTFRITMVDPGGGPTLEQGPGNNGGGTTMPVVLSSGSLTAPINQRFEFDAGTIVANGGDFLFARMGSVYFLTPQSGARIWVGNTSARGFAGCSAGAANHVTTATQVPANGTYVCYRTSDNHVGELQITNLNTGQFGQNATLAVNYTTWQ